MDCKLEMAPEGLVCDGVLLEKEVLDSLYTILAHNERVFQSLVEVLYALLGEA